MDKAFSNSYYTNSSTSVLTTTTTMAEAVSTVAHTRHLVQPVRSPSASTAAPEGSGLYAYGSGGLPCDPIAAPLVNSKRVW